MRFHHHPNKENRKSEIYYTEVVKIAFFPFFNTFICPLAATWALFQSEMLRDLPKQETNTFFYHQKYEAF